MSDAPDQPEAAVPPTTPPTPPPPTTVVVGYPDLAPPRPATSSTPGTDHLVRQVRTMRLLVAACLGVVLVLAGALGFALVNTQSQLDALGTQITELEAKAAAPAPAAPAATAATPAPVTQLGPSAELESVVSLPAGVDKTGAVLIGNPNAANVVEVYVDYQCPFCQKWEQSIGAPLYARALNPDGDLLIKQYSLAFLGEQNLELTPAGASARAASAAACVLNADGQEKFVAFTRSLFATADPSEPSGQFPADQLVSLAKEAGASPDAVTCITNEQHVPFVAATTKTAFARGVGGTPTVIVNGTTVANPFSDPTLVELAKPVTTS